MNTTLVKAAEAKKIASSLNNEINEKLFKNVADKIQNAASKGHMKITVPLTDMTDVIVEHIKDLGYTVIRTSGDSCSGTNQYTISWDKA